MLAKEGYPSHCNGKNEEKIRNCQKLLSLTTLIILNFEDAALAKPSTQLKGVLRLHENSW